MRPVLLLLPAVLMACSGQPDASTGRQAEVAARGRLVMPFDLDKTHHAFAKDSSGGVQTVTANAPGDTLNVRLIREHLRDEAERFRRGDFGDPQAIHGEEMPGVAELGGAAGRIDVDFAELPDGGRIRYATADPVLVAAVHRWFDAQVSDHGRHASHRVPDSAPR